jgi:hypothetical protein
LTVTQRAKKVGRTAESTKTEISLEDQKKLLTRLCPCCGLDPEVTLTPLSCNTMDLGDYGTGYSLFFHMQKFTVYALFVLALCSIYSLARNAKGTQCLSVTDTETRSLAEKMGICIKDWVTQHSIANWISKSAPNVDIFDQIFMIAFFVVYMISLGLYHSVMKGKAQYIDQQTDEPSDWTVVMKELDPKTTEDDIRDYFKSFVNTLPGYNNEGVEIVKINSSYKIKEYEEKLQIVRTLKSEAKELAYKEILEKKKSILKQESLQRPPTSTDKSGSNSPSKNPLQPSASSVADLVINEDALSSEYKALVERLGKENKELETLHARILANREYYFNGVCFVTFKNREITDDVIKRIGTKESMYKKLFCCMAKKKIYMATPNIKTSFILKRAQAPSDINWQNLGSNIWATLTSRFMTFSLSFVLLLISFGGQLGLKAIQKQMANRTQSESALSFSGLSYRAVSVGVTIVILIINLAIPMALRHLTLLEKHTTNSTFCRSLTLKITLVSFCLTKRLNLSIPTFS